MKNKLRVLAVLLLSLLAACGGSSPAPSAAWKFAYFSDNKDATDASGVNTATVGRMAQDMKDQGVALVLAGGDLIDGRGLDQAGLVAEYDSWFAAMAPVYDANIPVYAVPGNHEYWCDTNESCVAAWQEAVVPLLPSGRTDNADYPGREYSFTYSNAFFIGLDQNQFGSSMPAYYRGNDIDWIDSQLASYDSATYIHIISFGHMPQFMLQYGWSDANKANREEFWNALGAAGSKMYFTGHSHTYALGLATTEDGAKSIYQILVGSAGAGFEDGSWNGVYYESDRVTPVERNNEYEGYALVTIDGSSVIMVWRYYDASAGAFSSMPGFSYVKE